MNRADPRKALRFHAWRSFRWWLIATPFVIGHQWIAPWIQGTAEGLFQNNLLSLVSGLPEYGLDWTTLWCMLFGVISLGLSYRQGGLLSILSAPIRRGQMFDAHALLTGLTLVGSVILLAAYLCALDGMVGAMVPIPLILALLAKRLLVYLAAWATGLAAGATIAHPAVAFACAAGVTGFPAYVSLLSLYLRSRWLSSVGATPLSGTAHPVASWQTGFIERLAAVCVHMSPLSPLDDVMSPQVFGYALWFVAWILGMYELGRLLFERLPLEHAAEVFPFHTYWNLLGIGIGLVAGFLASVWFTQSFPSFELGVGAIAIWLAFSACVGLAISAGARRQLRPRQGIVKGV